MNDDQAVELKLSGAPWRVATVADICELRNGHGIGDFFKLRLHIPEADEQRAIATVINTAEAEERTQMLPLQAD